MTTPERIDAIREVVVRCTELQATLHALGLYRSGHAMHEVVREVGWEFAAVLGEAKGGE